MRIVEGNVIVQFANTLQNADGGPARYAAELNRHLRSFIPQAELIHWSKGPESSQTVANSHQVKAVKLCSVGGLLSVRSSLNRTQQVVIHGYFLPWVPLVIAMCSKSTKIIIIPHGSLTSWQSNRHRLRKFLWNHTFGSFIAKRAHLFTVASEREGLELTKVLRSATFKVVGMGLDIPKDLPPTEARGQKSALRLLSLSRITHKKRIDLSIQACAWIKEAGKKATLQIAGSGDDRLEARLVQLSQQLGVSFETSFSGELIGSAKWEAFRESDIFLLPGEDENFGVTVAEATSMGVPVITTYNVDSADLLCGDGIYRLKEWHKDALLEAIEEASLFIKDAARVASLRQRTIEKIDWDRVTERLLDSFKQ